jgi:hypothetical protein
MAPALSTQPVTEHDRSHPIGFLTRGLSQTPGLRGKRLRTIPTLSMPRLCKFMNAPSRNPGILLRNTQPIKEIKIREKWNICAAEHLARPSGVEREDGRGAIGDDGTMDATSGRVYSDRLIGVGCAASDGKNRVMSRERNPEEGLISLPRGVGMPSWTLRVVAAGIAAGNPRLRCRSVKREYGSLGRSQQTR